jgi:pyruvate formate-lyase activating enzyme-like uncharacterized protein
VDGMIKNIDTNTISRIKNKSLVEYSQIHLGVQNQTLNTIETFGIALEKRNLGKKEEEQRAELKKAGALFRNNNHSIVSNGKISSACEACQTGTGSYTTFVSLKCHRDCYFCFNKNQDDYSFYVNHHKDVNQELSELLKSGVELKHLALTGGEPLLHKEEAIDFFKMAYEETPETYTRLYTAGDLLDEETLQMLQKYDLNEIRFSIKMEDSEQKRNHILGRIELAKKYIPYVLVEMPVIPGKLEEMKELLLTLDKMGIFGINLLEFCFPLENAKAFHEKGFNLKNPPYDVYYNYWYAGGLAVDESEQHCLELVDFSIQKNLKLGVHYCSLENKFTGQIYQQNHRENLGETYTFSEIDYFFKTVKAFGKDVKKVKEILEQHHVPYEINSDYNYIQFPTKSIEKLGKKNIDLVISSNVVELDGKDRNIREVKIEWTTPMLFEENDIR